MSNDREALIDRLAFCLYHQPLHGMPYDDCRTCAVYLAEAARAESAKEIAAKDAEIERLKRAVDELRNPWCLTSPRYKDIMRRYMPGVFYAIEALASAEKGNL